MSSLEFIEPPQNRARGLYPPYPKPFSKHNYTSAIEHERNFIPCRECDIETTLFDRSRIRPPIGIYHNNYSNRFSDGMPPRFNHHLTPCSNYLEHQLSNVKLRRHLDLYGLYWMVPWQKSKSQRVYASPTPERSLHEKDPTNFAAWSMDKVNSSLLTTEKGFIRYIPGVYTGGNERIRSSARKNATPRWMYSPPKWLDYLF